MLLNYIVYEDELCAKLYVNGSFLPSGMQLILKTMRKVALSKNATNLIDYKTPCNGTKTATL